MMIKRIILAICIMYPIVVSTLNDGWTLDILFVFAYSWLGALPVALIMTKIYNYFLDLEKSPSSKFYWKITVVPTVLIGIHTVLIVKYRLGGGDNYEYVNGAMLRTNSYSLEIALLFFTLLWLSLAYFYVDAFYKFKFKENKLNFTIAVVKAFITNISAAISGILLILLIGIMGFLLTWGVGG